ncbi:MAG: ribonuclease III [Chloroflexota bacterium]|nr:MAG: ribonuclease III [Chloroflexota bacterium]
MDDLRSAESNLGISFNDYSFLLRALTHRSYLNENPGEALEDNERLEFLGDAVLDFVVAAYLYHRFPEMDEGELTMLRAALVRTRTLAGIAKQLDIDRSLRLGFGEAESGGRDRLPTLCAAFEAVVGAIYLDQGLEVAESWIHGLIGPHLQQIIAESAHKDAKSEFQIWAQSRYNATPRYQVIDDEGPDHDKTFTVAVLVEEEMWGVGQGGSKQEAAQVAAGVALERADLVDAAAESGDDSAMQAGA